MYYYIIIIYVYNLYKPLGSKSEPRATVSKVRGPQS